MITLKKKKQSRLVKRRRREGRTDYRKRLVLMKGGFPRLIVRKSNKYLILQIVESLRAQDKVHVTVSTRDLLKYGWPLEKSGSLKSLGACYLAGILIGKKLGNKIKGRFILDKGLIPSTKGSRVYSAVKGFKDSGKDIAADESVFPPEDKITKFDFIGKIKNKIGGNPLTKV